MHYLCTANDEISLRQIKIHRGMEQLVARRAHNPKVVWFESHSRYSKEKRKFLLFSLRELCVTYPPNPLSVKGAYFK